MEGYSIRGWNWGHYSLEKDELQFNTNKNKCFTLKYRDIALVSATGKNEVTLEMASEDLMDDAPRR